ncbi:GNAT family N-acetyltransferase [Psychrobacter pygoscelis]|uniref:GNAT family N-acetyltransferase n=1 Tax=Psychrobacter pygoscelis TaxID=2488563 RepID=UPI00104078E1|nr:GNAT family protein [Psychrobacter pygoscelis]
MKINLQPFNIDDTEKLSQWIEDERSLIQFSGGIFTFPITRSQIQEYLADTKRHVYKVLISRKVVGHAEIYLDEAQSAKLCRILVGDPDMRGKGIGQLIIFRLLTIAFTEFNVQRVHLNVYDWNTTAIKCYEKVGLQINPGKSTHIPFRNDSWTAINMVIDKAGWQERRHKEKIG